MVTYIALLRGINVGGRRSVRMKELKGLCEDLGFRSVSTYIQSGNVVFQSGEENAATLRQRLEEGMEQRFGFAVKALVVEGALLDRLHRSNPFPGEEPSRVLMTFLDRAPDPSLADRINQVKKDSEEFRILDAGVLLFCPEGYGTTKISHTFLEKKTGSCGTTRNWKTLRKLREMVRLTTSADSAESV